MHVPNDSGPDTRRAIQEILDKIRNLESKLSSIRGVATQAELDDVKKDLIRATQRPQTLDFEDVMRGSGAAHALGYVPDPGPYTQLTGGRRFLGESGRWEYILDGLVHVFPQGAGGTSKAQRIINIFASVAGINGLSVDTIYCREAYVHHVPYCVARRTTDQTFTTGAQAAINFDAHDVDTDSIHNTVTNNNRLTMSRTGLWLVGGAVRFAANATGFRRIIIRKNGADVLASGNWETVTAVAQDIYTEPVLRRFIAGDYVELLAVQSSGGDLACQAVNFLAPYFWAYWMAM